MKLYGYFRSSAAYRVRIALNLKGLAYEHVGVHLLNNGGEQRSDAYRALNPSALVPTLVDGDLALGQSLAILEYLEEAYPHTVALLPQLPAERAKVRAFAASIACDIHPLNNLRVLGYLNQQLGVNPEQRSAWYAHWVDLGLSALEAQLANHSGLFCFGDSPSLADCCLMPQLYNAKRFNLDLSAYPNLMRIDQHCHTLDAFQQAAPENQPDAV
ncbi:MAG: maleylacetoacetate isomerase [Neisseriaceae bacterium]|nr:maleylacetoacetate isomerase [Neisseriaceae bacterium]MBP6862750.1 maleylacetoacetate isomerase [Neisseriaceae bacterium]